MAKRPQPTPASFVKAINSVLTPGVRSSTVFQDPHLTVTATHHDKPGAHERQTVLLVTFGEPNYANRQFVKDCVKAGETFPVRKAKLSWFKE